jgi:hypothetical protein
MLVVDTNVLVFAANEDAPDHAACHALIERWRGHAEPWHATWPILYEFLRVVTHPKVLKPAWSIERALEFVDAVRAARSFSLLLPTERHDELLAGTVGEVRGLRGNIVHDLHTVVLMREHGVRRIVTRDTDFHRFPFVEVVDPIDLD